LAGLPCMSSSPPDPPVGPQEVVPAAQCGIARRERLCRANADRADCCSYRAIPPTTAPRLRTPTARRAHDLGVTITNRVPFTVASASPGVSTTASAGHWPRTACSPRTVRRPRLSSRSPHQPDAHLVLDQCLPVDGFGQSVGHRVECERMVQRTGRPCRSAPRRRAVTRSSSGWLAFPLARQRTTSHDYDGPTPGHRGGIPTCGAGQSHVGIRQRQLDQLGAWNPSGIPGPQENATINGGNVR